MVEADKDRGQLPPRSSHRSHVVVTWGANSRRILVSFGLTNERVSLLMFAGITVVLGVARCASDENNFEHSRSIGNGDGHDVVRQCGPLCRGRMCKYERHYLD